MSKKAVERHLAVPRSGHMAESLLIAFPTISALKSFGPKPIRDTYSIILQKNDFEFDICQESTLSNRSCESSTRSVRKSTSASPCKCSAYDGALYPYLSLVDSEPHPSAFNHFKPYNPPYQTIQTILTPRLSRSPNTIRVPITHSLSTKCQRSISPKSCTRMPCQIECITHIRTSISIE